VTMMTVYEHRIYSFTCKPQQFASYNGKIAIIKEIFFSSKQFSSYAGKLNYVPTEFTCWIRTHERTKS